MKPATTSALSNAGWRAWAPDLAAGLLVLAFGVFEIVHDDLAGPDPGLFWVVAATAAAVGLSRRLPLLSLLLIWVFWGYQVSQPLPLLYVQFSVAVVAFGCACWGHPITVFLSGVSIPIAGVIAVVFAGTELFNGTLDVSHYGPIVDAVRQVSGSWRFGVAILGAVLLGVPWLAGLTLRFSRIAAESATLASLAEENAARAERESEQAREIAHLQEEQAKLAHDVHDVVGHSLAVILAQAESAQFLDESDTGALRASMATIAASARGSLRDVRQVLTPESAGVPGDLHDLVEGVRGSGHSVGYEVTGRPRPLPPERATVAYRVLQEMLTNAIRHGRRDLAVDAGVTVSLDWGDELRIAVSNVVAEPADPVEPGQPTGQGIDGMRRRLASIGGRLDVRSQAAGGTADTAAGTAAVFLATAWVPVRGVTR